jgi:hypothetical protein
MLRSEREYVTEERSFMIRTLPKCYYRRMRWAQHVVRMVEMRNTHGILDVSLNGKKSVGKSKLKWENNVKVAGKEVRCEGIDGFI